MKRMVKCMAMLGMLAALLGFSARAEEATGEFNWANYGRAQAYHDQLMSFFAKDSAGEIAYPDFVGGIYYNDEGDFVLQIVEGYAAKDAGLYDRVRDFAAQADGLIVETVEHSYNEIHGLMDTLNAMCLAYGRPAAFDNVDWFGEDTSGNRVVMNLAVCSEEEIARFRDTVSDSPMIGFEQSQGKLVEISAASINWVGVAVIIALLGLIGLGTILLWRAVRRGKRESI